MGKRGRRAIAASGAPRKAARVTPGRLPVGAATSPVGRIKESWHVAGQRPAQSGTVGLRPRVQRPASLFGGLPLSEFLILLGIIAIVVGFARGPSAGAVPIIVGVGLSTIAVLEFTAREHFRGYRSHSLLLALMTMVTVNTGVVFASDGAARSPLLLVFDAALFIAVTVVLRRTFKGARARATGQTPI